MRKKIKKWLCAVMMIIAIAVGQTGGALAVNAQEAAKSTSQGIADFENGDASIEIRGNAGQTLEGKKFYIYRLFDAENSVDLETIDYTLNEEYAEEMKTVVGKRLNKSSDTVTEYEIIDYMQSLNHYVVEGAQTQQTLESTYSEYRYFAEELLEAFHASGVTGAEVFAADTKYDNSIEIKGLPYGYYMVEDISEAAGEHSAVSMAMLSTANPESSVNIKADYPTVVKKIQEDDNQETVGNDGWNDIGDFEIGQDVPYRYQSNIPNMNGYDTYYYAWHDCMDEALTLQTDSIVITISGKVGDTDKTYQLSEQEYQLITQLEDESFIIEVKDIKAIVDREFDQIDDRNENIYGQTVTVNYTATLNDKAALRIGKPGFENEVRLEFSNNPNSTGEGQTGYTPWDTVVCFTYQLSGVKVNNYGKELEGASFRLYYDQACENEVYVKETEAGYVVMHEDSWNGDSPEGAVAMISDEKGEFCVLGLDGGVYYLKEESAPAGYRPILDPIKIQVTPIFQAERNSYVKGDGAGEDIFTLTADAHIITFTDGSYEEEDVVLGTDTEAGKVNLSVINEVGKKLPITGSYFMPILIGIGVLFIFLSFRKGHKKNG